MYRENARNGFKKGSSRASAEIDNLDYMSAAKRNMQELTLKILLQTVSSEIHRSNSMIKWTLIQQLFGKMIV